MGKDKAHARLHICKDNWQNNIIIDIIMADLKGIRDQDFKRECRRQTKLAFELGEIPAAREIVARAVRSSAPGYYLDYDYALTTLYRVRNGMRPRRQEKRLMWDEIERKVNGIIASGEEPTLASALNRVLADERASRYFITPGYGKKLYEQLRRRPRRQATEDENLTRK